MGVLMLLLQQVSSGSTSWLDKFATEPPIIAAIIGLSGVIITQFIQWILKRTDINGAVQNRRESDFAKERADFLVAQAEFRRDIQREVEVLRDEVNTLKTANRSLSDQLMQVRAENIELHTENITLREKVGVMETKLSRLQQ